jgi:hypothetical protein
MPRAVVEVNLELDGTFSSPRSEQYEPRRRELSERRKGGGGGETSVRVTNEPLQRELEEHVYKTRKRKNN